MHPGNPPEQPEQFVRDRPLRQIALLSVVQNENTFYFGPTRKATA